MKYLFKLAIAAIAVVGLTACDAGSTGNADSASATATHSQIEHLQPGDKKIVMYKSPTCKCCTGWAEHLRKAGFTVIVHKREDMNAIKTRFGVPAKLASCHTAIVGGYIIEGHVPAADVGRLLKEKPQIAGLTAPGMPKKAPGMQSPGLTAKGYDVLAFDKDGSTTVYHRY